VRVGPLLKDTIVILLQKVRSQESLRINTGKAALPGRPGALREGTWSLYIRWYYGIRVVIWSDRVPPFQSG